MTGEGRGGAFTESHVGFGRQGGGQGREEERRGEEFSTQNIYLKKLEESGTDGGPPRWCRDGDGGNLPVKA